MTDDAALAAGAVPKKGWEIVYEPRSLSPVRAAKLPKMSPWNYTACESSVWVDASISIRSTDFAANALEAAEPIAMYPHPERDDIFDEANATLEMLRYEPQFKLISEQIHAYQSHPKNWGLWAAGIIARRHTEKVKTLCFAWQYEINRYSSQDQISLPVVALKNGLRPTDLSAGDIWKSNYHKFIGSTRHSA